MIQPPETTSPAPTRHTTTPGLSAVHWPTFAWLVGGILTATLLICVGLGALISGGSTPSPSDGSASATTSTSQSREPNDPAYFGYATVPNLVGLTGDQASAAMTAADFRATRFTVNYASMTSTVQSQTPAAGTWWSKTSPVNITLDPTTATSTSPQPTAAYTPAPTPEPAPYVTPSTNYTYKITGKNRAMITYTNTGGNTSQVSSAKLPWSKTVDSPGYSGMDFAYISAQNSGSGTISCQIIGPAGTVISENSSEGAYAIVTCQNSD